MTANDSGSPSIEARIVALARRALEQTRAGVMEWRTTDDDDAYTFSGTKTSLIIDRYRHDDSYEFRVVNEKGLVVEELGRKPKVVPSQPDPWTNAEDVRLAAEYQLFADLHESARRSAFDIDSLLDSAFEDLETPPDLRDEPELRETWSADDPPF